MKIMSLGMFKEQAHGLCAAKNGKTNINDGFTFSFKLLSVENPFLSIGHSTPANSHALGVSITPAG